MEIFVFRLQVVVLPVVKSEAVKTWAAENQAIVPFGR